MHTALADLKAKIENKTAKIGILGLGYVGLPLVQAFCDNGFHVIGFDINESAIEKLKKGQMLIKHIPSIKMKELIDTEKFDPTSYFTRLNEPDVLIICVPTPLNKYREPDLTYIEDTCESIRHNIRKGQLITLESTTYPGTTLEVMKPMLEQSGFKCDEDFFLAYSPEREDPGNKNFNTHTIPKVVGADDPDTLDVAKTLYEKIIGKVVPVSSAATAEAVKITENVFRSVNIALVNELKIVYDKMGIDVWEVIDAAATKPFGFMPFYPGPGLGGHCIPIDPFYLTWKAREYDVHTRFIELAGEINTHMPHHVVKRIAEALSEKFQKSIHGSKLLVLGAAYKKNVDDMRESPALEIMHDLKKRGANLDYYDSYVPVIPKTRKYAELTDYKSIEWSPAKLAEYDAAIILTDHDDVDYNALVQNSKLVIDSRNATKAVTENRNKIVKV